MSQVKELDGNWAAVEIYRSKKNPDDVVLFFGGEEYEGLEGGYRYAKGPDNRMVLKDSDGGVIELRSVAAYDKAKAKRISQERAVTADVTPPSNKKTCPSPKQATITKKKGDFNIREYTTEKTFKDKIQV